MEEHAGHACFRRFDARATGRFNRRGVAYFQPVTRAELSSKSGKGTSVDVSMLESMCHFNIDAFTHYFAIGDVMGPYSRPRASQSYVLECSDGKWIALHMSSPEKFWQGLARVIEYPSLFDDPRFADRVARIVNHEALIKTLAGFFIERPRAEWAALLEKEDVPYAPMYLVDEAVSDPQFVHLRIETKAEHPTQGTFRSVRSPVNFGGDRTPLAAPPPTLDEHREEILHRAYGFTYHRGSTELSLDRGIESGASRSIRLSLVIGVAN